MFHPSSPSTLSPLSWDHLCSQGPWAPRHNWGETDSKPRAATPWSIPPRARSCSSVIHSFMGQELLLCRPFLHGPGSIFHTLLHFSFCKQQWWWPQSYGGQWVKRRKWEGKIVAKTLISCVFLRKPPGTGRMNRFSNYSHSRLLRVALSDNIPRV